MKGILSKQGNKEYQFTGVNICENRKKKHEETQFWKTIFLLTETSIGFTFQWSVLLEFINTDKCPLQNTIQIFYTSTSVCLFFILLSPYMFEDAGRENLF